MKRAFLFPGQGAQYPGMGKDFAEQHAVARQTYEEADEILKRHLSKIVLEGPEDLLKETRNSQTGIFVTSVALLKVVRELFPNLVPTFAAGLSLGEYTALYAAGILDFETALKLVDKRSQYMNDACEKTQGTMAVIMGLSAEAVESLVKELNMPNDLWAANFNCPGQVVISGTLKGVEAGSAAALSKGAKRALPLQVHGAFHSGLMESARERLQEHILAAPFKESNVKVAMNAKGDFVTSLDEMRHLLIEQVTHPVRWEQSVRAMDHEQAEQYIEIGCGKTLSGMNRKIGVKGTTVSVEKLADLEALAACI